MRGIDHEVNKEQFIDLCAEKLGVTEEIESVTPVTIKGKLRHTLITMASVAGRDKILKNKAIKLKGTKISINRDLTYNERVIQRKIRDIANDISSKGNKVRVKYRTLEINDEKFVWEEGKGLMPFRDSASSGSSQISQLFRQH